MRLFDFLRRDSSRPSIDLSDLKFISDDHIRYESGRDVSGHNKDCWRGVRIQTIISNIESYTVTIYNLDANHSLWGDNIQMVPKQMKLIELTNSVVIFRGFGIDKMGKSFADYGLTLHLNNNAIEKITLHLHDRNVDIVYIKAISNKTQEPQLVAEKQIIPLLSTDMSEIMALSEIIHKCKDLNTLNHVYSQMANYNNPQICYDFGVAFLIKGDKTNAKKALTKGAIYGITYPCAFYNNILIDSVGQSFSILMTQFPIADNSNAIKVTALGYIYLSRCIELYGKGAHDSYRTRALLFKDHENPNTIRILLAENVGTSFLAEPYIISDFYFSCQGKHSPHQSSKNIARQIHEKLEGITVGGKDACEYTLTEMAEFGEKRHLLLFKTLEQKYKSGAFNLTTKELESASR